MARLHLLTQNSIITELANCPTAHSTSSFLGLKRGLAEKKKIERFDLM